jgi:hypothetical protein
MIYKFISIIFFLTFSYFSYSQNQIILEGNFQGKNLYIQNPYGNGGVGYCVIEVLINGNITSDEINSSAFEIDFSAQNIKLGEKVEVIIKYKNDCKPKIVNPEVLKPKSTFQIVTILVNKEGILNWSTTNEYGKLPFIIEQFRWNKWIKVGELEGIGTKTTNNYSFKVSPHSGKNQFRVKQIDYSGVAKTSKVVEFVSPSCEIVFTPVRVQKDIDFKCSDRPAETLYEVYDQYGNIVKRGFNSKLDCSNLPAGSYFLNFDNKTAEFTKKK